jgi:serine/threonine protein kinase
MPEAKKCPQCGATLPPGALEGLCPACLLKQAAAPDTAVGPDGRPFEPPAVEEVARWFPQLEVLGFLGKGGMGAVYKARQRSLDRLVALKILPPQAACGPGFAERFNREARALARLNHPNIVAVYEFGQVNDLPFFIMEFVDGLNLRELEHAGQLSSREALAIVPQICEALQFAHDEGIVHRDIKPENILMDKKGRVKIADFGIAKIMGREQEPRVMETQGAIGTPHYMAPEQVEKPQSVDHRADIFSLGVVFYEMLTGELPLGKFAPPSRKVDVDVRLDEVVLRALEKEPDRRYQQASQVRTAVGTIVATPAQSASPAQAGAYIREVLARDYQLNIRDCLRRGWALVRNNFWPLVGMNALMLALVALATTAFSYRSADGSRHNFAIVALLVNGPLFGGWNLYFLKKIRGEPSRVETAFAGFSGRFLHLFLANFVMTLLCIVGFVCFVLPGIYLFISWWFALTLVIDKGLDFWPAMELSRKAVTKHWFKIFAFFLVLILVDLAGLVALGVGVFLTTTIVMAAGMYGYEDIFGPAGQAAGAAAPAMGPAGTVVSPPPPSAPKPPSQSAGGGFWKPGKIALAAVALVAAVVVVIGAANAIHRDMGRRHERLSPFTDVRCQTNSAIVCYDGHYYELEDINGLATADILQYCRQVYYDRWDKRFAEDLVEVLDNECRPMTRYHTVSLTLRNPATGMELKLDQAPMTSENRRAVMEAREAAAAAGAPSQISESGLVTNSGVQTAPPAARLAFGPFVERTLTNEFGAITFDSGKIEETWPPAANGTNGPDDIAEKVASLIAWTQAGGRDLVSADYGAEVYGANLNEIPLSPEQWQNLTASELKPLLGFPEASALPLGRLILGSNPPSYFGFETRKGLEGMLQISAARPSGIVLTYKLAKPGPLPLTADELSERLEAAGLIANMDERDRAIAGIVSNAVVAGCPGIVDNALSQMSHEDQRVSAARRAATALIEKGDYKEAREIADSEISLADARDQVLAALATHEAGDGNANEAIDSVAEISNAFAKDDAAIICARLLDKRGLRKNAVNMIQQNVYDGTVRDRALSELAQ